MKKRRYIIHIDMDAFFASIEQRDNPDYRRKPVIVGADPKGGKGRGVVSACSYESRKFGIHSAMPISIAYRKCPQAVFLPVNMKKYQAVSLQIENILRKISPKIEKISIDEAFIDISGSYHFFGTPYKTGVFIKSRIKEQTGLTASAGLAPNKFIAKIASDIGKPNGMVEVKQKNILKFLWPLDVGRVWGVGKKTLTIMNKNRIYTIGDLAKKNIRELTKLFGKNGYLFWQLANGMDDREVMPYEEIKSISNEYTFEHDTIDKQKIENVLLQLCVKISRRLRKGNLKGKTITLKIRLEDFETHTKSVTINSPTYLADTLYRTITEKYNSFDTYGKKIRLLGIKVSNFTHQNIQGNLFNKNEDMEKENRLQETIEKIQNKFGQNSICQGFKRDKKASR